MTDPALHTEPSSVGNDASVIDLNRREQIRLMLAGLAMSLTVVWGIMLTLVCVGTVLACSAAALSFRSPGGLVAMVTSMLAVAWSAAAFYCVVRYRRMAVAPREPAAFSRDLAHAANLSGLRVDIIDVMGQGGDSLGRRSLMRLRRSLLMVRPAMRRYDAVRELPRLAPFLPGAITATIVWSLVVVIGFVIWLVADVALLVANVLA